MTHIIIDEADRLEWALSKFRRLVQRSGVLKDLGKKRYYVKPSTAKRMKVAAAIRRRHRASRRSR